MVKKILHVTAIVLCGVSCKSNKTAKLEHKEKNYRNVTVYSIDSLTVTRYIMDGDSVVAVTGYAAPPEYFERAEQRKKERGARRKKTSK